ncbi:Hypothetical predicted protein [Mytilus galloprovincialis]|uniref:Uncharacterized protein n=1 Tax=Mytilus galloprovincialis TaxID=29158 RepID=A0A8B6C2H1_MYTGA|nr:Hypothetical predicted protein [Mytilus galloprovincialis]
MTVSSLDYSYIVRSWPSVTAVLCFVGLITLICVFYWEDQVTALDDSGPIKRARQTIPVKGVPLLIPEDTCSQEISKSEQADLSQTSDSSRMEIEKTVLHDMTKEARITISPEDS